MRGSARVGLNPRARLPGRLVTDVLPVSTVEDRDPVAVVVLRPARDRGEGKRSELGGTERLGEGLLDGREPRAVLEAHVLLEPGGEGVELVAEAWAWLELGDGGAEGGVVLADRGRLGREIPACLVAPGQQDPLLDLEVRLELAREAIPHESGQLVVSWGERGPKTFRRVVLQLPREDERVVMVARQGVEMGVALHGVGEHSTALRRGDRR